MLNRFVRRINLSIIIVTSILLIIGFWYENPLFERGLKLMVLSLLFLGVLIFLTYSTRISKREYGYIILLVLLSIFDFYSKYSIS
jgi:hypothetical protein